MEKWLQPYSPQRGVITDVLSDGETEAGDLCDKPCSLDNHFLPSRRGRASGTSVHKPETSQ